MTNADPDRLEWDEFVARGKAIAVRADRDQWSLGWLACEIETHYGENDLAKFADAIGIHLDALTDYRYVASRFLVRTKDVPFSIYRLLAKLDDREDWLERAEREHWTVSRARRAIAQRNEAPATAPMALTKTKHHGQQADKIVTRFRTIEQAFVALREDEDREDAEPEDLARALMDIDRRRAVEAAVERASQFVDKWSNILVMEVTSDEFESA